MVFVLLVSVILTTPYLPYIGGRYQWEGRIKMCQLAHHQLMSQQGPHFSTAKTNDRSTFFMVSSGISDVVIAQDNRLLTSAMKLRPEK